MPERSSILVLSRRTFFISAAAAAVPSPCFAQAAETQGSGPGEPSANFKDELAKIIGSAKPADGKVTIDLPEIAENGNFVPITITVDSPMTDADYVKAVHILSTENPVARVATFHLRPANAVARVQSRMRLAKTQDVVVLAELSSGQMFISTTMVKVTIGGCAS